SPDGTRVYISHTDDTAPNVTVLDATSNTIATVIPVGPARPTGVAVYPGGTGVYVNNIFLPSQAGSLLHAPRDTVGRTEPLGEGPQGVVVSPDCRRTYIADVGGFTVNGHEAGQVVVLDTASQSVVASVPLAGQVGSVAVSPDGAHVYATFATAGTNAVAIIDAA